AGLLLTLINDILDFSKIEAGKLLLEHAEFDVRETVGGAVRTLSVQAHPKGLEMVCDFDADVPDLLEGDPMRLVQVLNNLLGNAIKFTERGEISIAVATCAREEA